MIALNSGNVMTRYRFPRVDIPFSSPVLRWENLWFCGGWSTQGPNGEEMDSGERLLQAVIDGLKPMGFICGPQAEIETLSRRTELAELPHTVKERHFEGRTDLCVRQHGAIEE